MRVEPHPGRSGGPPLGASFGAVGVLAAGLAALWFRLGLPQPVCQFRSLTGFSCPTCGSTRLVEALLGGNFAEAFSWNPLVFLVLVGVAVWAVVSAVRWIAGAPPSRIVLGPWERWVVRVGAVAAVAVGWAYLLYQGV